VHRGPWTVDRGPGRVGEGFTEAGAAEAALAVAVELEYLSTNPVGSTRFSTLKTPSDIGIREGPQPQRSGKASKGAGDAPAQLRTTIDLA